MTTEVTQGWYDPQSGRSYVMGKQWSRVKFTIQCMDCHLYSCCISSKGALCLFIVLIAKTVYVLTKE